MTTHCALVLPGAVAKGAYEAGVIDVLVNKNIKIDRIVATSSGALNGVALAIGIRRGMEKEMAALLTKTWIESGDWQTSFSFNPWNWIRGHGLSSPAGLLKMLRNVVGSFSGKPTGEVDLRIVVSPLNGVLGKIGNSPATTYEKFIHFNGEDLDTHEGLERVFEVTTAACAFPGLFSPVNLPGLGPCVDGGAVNNAPIGYALRDSDVDRIIMPVPFPELMPEAPSIKGISLLNHLIEILINERLYRELKYANSVNEDVTAIEKLISNGILNSEQSRSVKEALKIRHVHIKEIRPEASLNGNPFSGFFSKAERIKLVEEGRASALKVLSDKVSQSKVEKS